jgi:hypothetical protein
MKVSRGSQQRLVHRQTFELPVVEDTVAYFALGRVRDKLLRGCLKSQKESERDRKRNKKTLVTITCQE